MEIIKRFEDFINEFHKKIIINFNKIRNTKDKKVKKFLNSITDDDIKKIWIDYNNIRKIASHTNPLTTDMCLSMNEGLISTYPIDKTIEYISSYFDFIPQQIEIKKAKSENDIDYIIVYIPVINDNLGIIKKSMSLCGYFLGFPKEHEIKQGQFNWLQFEPIVQKNESDKIRKEENKLYHITPHYNLGKIKNIGFSPHSKNELFNYPNRVYFLRGSLNNENIQYIAKQLNKYNSSEGNDGKYVLLTIDIEKIPKDIKMYLDPNYPYGIFVTENIKPNVIINVKELTLKNN